MWRVWRGLKEYELDNDIPPTTTITVVVAVRNEAENIFNLLEDLNKQDYPEQNFEVIIVDDNSEDETVNIVHRFLKKAIFTLKVFPAGNSKYEKDGFGKKNAIEVGISAASGELIVTTDGDCRLNSGWLTILQNFYVSKDAKFISAPVSFNIERRIQNTEYSYSSTNHQTSNPLVVLQRISHGAWNTLRSALCTLFDAMQTIEFAGLIAVGASSITKGSPNMCNGANIAFTKKIFYEVNGFEGYKDIASGDDEFLMHKIFEHSTSVYFLKNTEATVYTSPAKKISQFIAQRKRWASKWTKYADIKVRLLAIFIFCVNLCLIAFIILVIFQKSWYLYFLILILIKMLVEYVFLSSIMKFFNLKKGLGGIKEIKPPIREVGKKFNYLAFLLIELFHPFYVVLLGCLSNLGAYWWKGRRVR